MRVGLISDTHDLLRPQAAAFLRGCDHIVHAGDIGESILEQLAALAPVTAVRGNTDWGAWARPLQLTELIELGGVRLHVVHDIEHLTIDPLAEGIAVVVTGHSHQPRIQQHGSVLYVNPGSAGPRRFKLPVSVGELVISRGKVTARIVELAIG